MQSKKSCPTAKSLSAVLLTFLLASAITAQPAQAQKFKALHTFHRKDGANPNGQFLWDAHGNLIGTTANGGTGNCSPGHGCVTVFKMNTSGKILWSYSLTNYSEGFIPNDVLYQDLAGNLYGTTNYGGFIPCYEGDKWGCGILFKLDTARKETVLYRFKGSSNGRHDGWYPEGLPVGDAVGNLYGSTVIGGAGDNGIVFRISQAGKEKILYSFSGPYCQPPGGPAGALILRPGDKRFYGGVCGAGTYGEGTAIRMTTSGKLTVLYNFTGGGGPSNGGGFTPHRGSLYGVGGGGSGNCGYGGCGTVFELSPNGGTWTEKTLYVFCQVGGCKDGEFPDSRLVI